MVVNLSDVDVPDAAYLYLGKGNAFIPAVKARKHDLVYDTKSFLRKVAWHNFFHEFSKHSQNIFTSTDDVIPEKLRLVSKEWPEKTSNLFKNFQDGLMDFVNNLDFSVNRGSA